LCPKLPTGDALCAYHPVSKNRGRAMSTIQSPKFVHDLNSDGDFNSFCLKCFETVATSATADELRMKEEAHVCFGPNFQPRAVNFRRLPLLG
jgi:hypothetical protein